MPKFFRRIIALLCILVFLLPSAPALAEFSPHYMQLKGQNDFSLSLTAQFDMLSPLSDPSLALVNDWLSQAKIELAFQGKNEAVSILKNDQPLLEIIFNRQADYTMTSFSSSQMAYLTNPGKKDALALLTDTDFSIPDFSGLPDLYAAWAPNLYPFLATIVSPKASKTTTSIKNANASAAYENYTLSADQMNAIWPQLLEMLSPLMQGALADQAALYQETEALLQELVFSGECRFKRFLDKSKGDMGLQFTGNAQKGNDLRKVTLFGGYTPGKGGYISLALPAIKGDNNFKITFTGKLSSKDNINTLTFESSFTQTLEGKTRSFALNGALKNALKNGDESWSGRITLETKADGISAVWTISPALSLNAQGVDGKITLQKKEGKNTKIKGTIFLNSLPDARFPAPAQAMAQDLRALDEAQARAVVAQEMIPLSRLLYQMMADLPEESRSLLTHDLRTEKWMNGESVPVSPGNPKDYWILDEDDEYCWIVEEEEE